MGTTDPVTLVSPDEGESIVFEDHVWVYNDYHGRETPRIAINVAYEDKELIKNLHWDTFHQTWDPDRERWLIDAEQVSRARYECEMRGFEVVVTNAVTEATGIT